MNTGRYIAKFLIGLFILLGVDPFIGLASIYDIKVNDDSGTSEQSNPRVAVSRNGDFAVVWTDKRGGETDIYFQLIDSSGTALSDNKQLINSTSGIPQLEPAISANYSSQFISVWRDYRNGSYPFNPDIYFARIDTTQTPSNVDVTSQINDVFLETPDIAMFTDGTSVTVWSDYRDGQWNIYGQRLNTTGSFIGSNFKINSGSGSAQHHSPRVSAFTNGSFVVAWYDNRLDNDDIFFQRFDSSAASIGLNTRASDDNSDAKQAFPDIASDGAGRFFICWVDWKNGSYPTNPDVYYRRFDSSGAAITASKKVNTNDIGVAQREPSIASDRLGNFCVVWADSVDGEWNVRGQIVDLDGAVSGSNFYLHSDKTGKQLQPDVASDGYKLYLTWADSRDGDFDIYATIYNYNNPSIIPSPDNLEFTMEIGGSLPDSQLILLANAGYGELDWWAETQNDWLAVTRDSGRTPDSFYVKITTDTLAYGTHYGSIVMVDLDNNDSTEAITVELNMTAPQIDIQPDTLYFKALGEIGDPDSRSFQIVNTGSGSFNWAASENASWVSLTSASGSDGDYLEVNIDVSGLVYDDYYAPIILTSSEAYNSPDTAWAHLELVGNMPFLDSRPDSFLYYAVIGDTIIDTIEIANLGAGASAWHIYSDSDWIGFNADSGSDYDTSIITILTSELSTGYTLANIIAYDSSSFNVDLTIPFEIFLSSGDTVQFVNANAMSGGIGMVPVVVDLAYAAKGAYVPIGYDSLLAGLDSIVVDTTLMPGFVDYFTNVSENGLGELGFRINDTSLADSLITSGSYYLANLFFTAADTNAHNYIDTTQSDSSGIYILNSSLVKVVPAVESGDLVIGSPTAVDDYEIDLLPSSYNLGQNYPNPFNNRTRIDFNLPTYSEISIDVYNILGQRVSVLADGAYEAGDHTISWNGQLISGQSAPSGIYFYKLQTGEFREVKKMVLLK